MRQEANCSSVISLLQSWIMHAHVVMPSCFLQGVATKPRKKKAQLQNLNPIGQPQPAPNSREEKFL